MELFGCAGKAALKSSTKTCIAILSATEREEGEVIVAEVWVVEAD